MASKRRLEDDRCGLLLSAWVLSPVDCNPEAEAAPDHSCTPDPKGMVSEIIGPAFVGCNEIVETDNPQ